MSLTENIILQCYQPTEVAFSRRLAWAAKQRQVMIATDTPEYNEGFLELVCVLDEYADIRGLMFNLGNMEYIRDHLMGADDDGSRLAELDEKIRDIYGDEREYPRIGLISAENVLLIVSEFVKDIYEKRIPMGTTFISMNYFQDKNLTAHSLVKLAIETASVIMQAFVDFIDNINADHQKEVRSRLKDMFNLLLCKDDGQYESAKTYIRTRLDELTLSNYPKLQALGR